MYSACAGQGQYYDSNKHKYTLERNVVITETEELDESGYLICLVYTFDKWHYNEIYAKKRKTLKTQMCNRGVD